MTSIWWADAAETLGFGEAELSWRKRNAAPTRHAVKTNAPLVYNHFDLSSGYSYPSTAPSTAPACLEFVAENSVKQKRTAGESLIF